VHIKDLVPDPQNRRRHNARNLGMVVDALQSVWAARSIVIDEDNVILAGNGVTEAAAEAGITKLHVVEVDGETLVAVRRRGLTDDQKRQLAIYDNRTSELAEWNPEQLRADQAAGLDLKPWFSPDELARIVGATAMPGLTDPDVVPEVRATTIQRGDLFMLGAHRLLCGDATDAADVARVLDGVVPALLVTDPPYGVDYDPTWRATAGVNKNRKKLGTVANDDRADWGDAWAHFPGAIAYVWHGGLKGAVVQASLERWDFALRAQIIWAKDRMALGRGDYHWQHEPCWYAVRGAAGARTDDRTQTTVWEIPARDDDGHTHGTQKPVECMARPMRNHVATDVYDPFVGSGTTLIAAESLARRCFALDIEPTYVQVAIDRWEAFTGQTAVKVAPETPKGTTHANDDQRADTRSPRRATARRRTPRDGEHVGASARVRRAHP
jgi:DNA modification methylase